jgi:hypothetical protein
MTQRGVYYSFPRPDSRVRELVGGDVAHELEVAVADSAGALAQAASHRHTPVPGTPCANCATPLQGPWCHACGQSGEDFHRSVGRLTAEVVEGLLHVDGRLWRTLPDLMLRPARLTTAYLEGHRAPQIPPLRLFLVVLLAIFVIGGLGGGSGFNITKPGRTTMGHDTVVTVTGSKSLSELSPAQRAEIQQNISNMKVVVGGATPNLVATNWLRDRLSRTLADPERFYLILEQWAERFAILMLPVSALLLSVLFVFQRRFYLFDHTIFSLHSLSAMGVAIILAMGLRAVIGDWAFALLAPLPAHLYGHMRGVYRTSVVGTLLRMALLFLGSSLAATLLVVGLISVGLNGMAR